MQASLVQAQATTGSTRSLLVSSPELVLPPWLHLRPPLHRRHAAAPSPAQLLPLAVHSCSRLQSVFKPDSDKKDTKPDSKKVGKGLGGSLGTVRSMLPTRKPSHCLGSPGHTM